MAIVNEKRRCPMCGKEIRKMNKIYCCDLCRKKYRKLKKARGESNGK